jgi:hypothetical protein
MNLIEVLKLTNGYQTKIVLLIISKKMNGNYELGCYNNC